MRRAITVSGMVILFLLGTMAPSPQTSAVRRPSTQRKNTRATKVSPASMSRSQRFRQLFDCDEGGAYCADVATHKSYEGKYTGHDEPALLFYSNKPGSGNSAIFRLTLPTDPPTPPQQDGTGGTFNFQTQGAFWFSMALCDNESAPAPDLNHVCTPDSDANIWEGTDPTKPKFVGLHPGAIGRRLGIRLREPLTLDDLRHDRPRCRVAQVGPQLGGEVSNGGARVDRAATA